MCNQTKFDKDLRQAQVLTQRVKESGIDITAEYPDWVRVALSLASLGEEGRPLFHEISSLYPCYKYDEADEKFSNVLRTGRGNVSLGTLIHICQEHGIDTSLPPGRPKGSVESQEKKENKMRILIATLKQMYQFRFNVWSKRTELLNDEGEWTPMEEREYSTIFIQLRQLGISFTDTDLRNLLHSKDFAVDYDVVKEWLSTLTPWDESQPDYIADLIGHIQFSDPENTDFYMRMIKKWFIGLVGMLSGRINEHSMMLVFTGGQRVGKTYMARNILPPCLSDLRFDANPAARVDNDFIISLSECGLVLMDEFSFSSNAMSDAYKYIVTSTVSHVRDVYAHNREKRERRATMIATTNNQRYIKDRDGDRRYLSVSVASTTNLNEHPINYEGAYAQAVYLLDHGYNCTPTADETAEISAHNVNFRELNDCEDAIQTWFLIPSCEQEAQVMSATEILTYMKVNGVNTMKITAQEVGKSMRNLGFTFKKFGNNTRFYVVPLNPRVLEGRTNPDNDRYSGSSTTSDFDILKEEEL